MRDQITKLETDLEGRDETDTEEHEHFEPDYQIYGFMQAEYSSFDPKGAEENFDEEQPSFKFSGVNLYLDFQITWRIRTLTDIAINIEFEDEETKSIWNGLGLILPAPASLNSSWRFSFHRTGFKK